MAANSGRQLEEKYELLGMIPADYESRLALQASLADTITQLKQELGYQQVWLDATLHSLDMPSNDYSPQQLQHHFKHHLLSEAKRPYTNYDLAQRNLRKLRQVDTIINEATTQLEELKITEEIFLKAAALLENKNFCLLVFSTVLRTQIAELKQDSPQLKKLQEDFPDLIKHENKKFSLALIPADQISIEEIIGLFRKLNDAGKALANKKLSTKTGDSVDVDDWMFLYNSRQLEESIKKSKSDLRPLADRLEKAKTKLTQADHLYNLVELNLRKAKRFLTAENKKYSTEKAGKLAKEQEHQRLIEIERQEKIRVAEVKRAEQLAKETARLAEDEKLREQRVAEYNKRKQQYDANIFLQYQQEQRAAAEKIFSHIMTSAVPCGFIENIDTNTPESTQLISWLEKIKLKTQKPNEFKEEPQRALAMAFHKALSPIHFKRDNFSKIIELLDYEIKQALTPPDPNDTKTLELISHLLAGNQKWFPHHHSYFSFFAYESPKHIAERIQEHIHSVTSKNKLELIYNILRSDVPALKNLKAVSITDVMNLPQPADRIFGAICYALQPNQNHLAKLHEALEAINKNWKGGQARDFEFPESVFNTRATL